MTDSNLSRHTHVLRRVGDKWALLVVGLLAQDTHRFSELRRAIDGISQKMLTQTLRNLERDGLVRRTIHAEVPPRVEYALTPLGWTLAEPVRSMLAWSERHMNEVENARAFYDRRQRAGVRPAPTPRPPISPGYAPPA